MECLATIRSISLGGVASRGHRTGGVVGVRTSPRLARGPLGGTKMSRLVRFSCVCVFVCSFRRRSPHLCVYRPCAPPVAVTLFDRNFIEIKKRVLSSGQEIYWAFLSPPSFSSSSDSSPHTGATLKTIFQLALKTASPNTKSAGNSQLSLPVPQRGGTMNF